MELRQDVVNTLATKYGLIPNPIETGSDGMQSVMLERDEADDRYCQALLDIRGDKVFCSTGLYRERAIIRDGEVQVGSVEEAFAHAAARFNIHAASLAEQYLENEYATYVKSVAENDPMEFDDWLVGSDIPEVVKARNACKKIAQQPQEEDSRPAMRM